MDIRPIGGLSQTKQASPPTAESGGLASTVKAAAVVAEKSVASVAVQPAQQTYSPEQVSEALKNINKTIQEMSPGVEFTVDDDSQRTIVKVVDQETHEVIRQMPTEEALAISKALDKLQGLLIQQKA